MKAVKPKKKAAGAAKGKKATAVKKKTRPAKAAKKKEKPIAPRKEPIRTITITPEQIKEWDKTRDLDPVVNNSMTWDKEEDAVWPPPIVYEQTDLDYRAPRLSEGQQKELDHFINEIGTRPSFPNKCKTPDALSGELAQQLEWYRETKLKGDSWAKSSETKQALERWRKGAEDLSEGLEDMLKLMMAYGMREPSCKYPKAIFVIEKLGAIGTSPFLNGLLQKLKKLIPAFQFAENKLKNRLFAQFPVNFI